MNILLLLSYLVSALIGYYAGRYRSKEQKGLIYKRGYDKGYNHKHRGKIDLTKPQQFPEGTLHD